MGINPDPPVAPDDDAGRWTYSKRMTDNSAFWQLRDAPINWYDPNMRDVLLLRLIEWRPKNGNCD